MERNGEKGLLRNALSLYGVLSCGEDAANVMNLLDQIQEKFLEQLAAIPGVQQADFSAEELLSLEEDGRRPGEPASWPVNGRNQLERDLLGV